MSSQYMFMQNRRAPMIDNVSFTKLAGNLFPECVEGEILPDLCYFGYADDLSTTTTHCKGCTNLTEIGRDALQVKQTCDDQQSPTITFVLNSLRCLPSISFSSTFQITVSEYFSFILYCTFSIILLLFSVPWM